MILQSLPDITPGGAASTLSEVGGSPGASLLIEARGIILIASGSSIRLGGSNVSATIGANLPSGVVVRIDAATPEIGTIPLHQTWVFGTGTDKVSILYWL